MDKWTWLVILTFSVPHRRLALRSIMGGSGHRCFPLASASCLAKVMLNGLAIVPSVLQSCKTLPRRGHPVHVLSVRFSMTTEALKKKNKTTSPVLQSKAVWPAASCVSSGQEKAKQDRALWEAETAELEPMPACVPSPGASSGR